MAEALGEPPSTVQSWKAAGRVPATKQPDVLRRGEELSLGLTAHDVVFPLERRPDCGDVPIGRLPFDDMRTGYRTVRQVVAYETCPVSNATR